MNTPVVIVFFNRIKPLRRLVSRLAEVMPPKLYLISDGAREDRPGEAEKVSECREFMRHIPWPCEIKTNFSHENLGCRVRVTSGLDWAFAQEEQLIILEDDCIPELEFFPWVERMLDKYRNAPNILSIGGTNLRPQLCDQSYDAVFSRYAMIWGWATWRRAWRQNDGELRLFQDVCKQHHLRKWLGKLRAEWYWRYLLAHIKTSWGYRWAFTHFAHKAFCVVPPVNLVENIGMLDDGATHTSNNPYDLAAPVKHWQMPTISPSTIESNSRLDSWIEDNFYSRSLLGRIKWLLRKLLKVG